MCDACVLALRLAFLTFKADLKARKQCHLLKHYYLCKRLCDRCAAIQPKKAGEANHPLSYKDLTLNAPYTTTTVSHEEYLRTSGKVSPWVAVKGWRLETCSFDLMHLVFLGVAKNHVPSCLKLLRLMGHHYEIGESDELFLKRVSSEMKLDCKDHKKPVSEIK